MPSCARHSGKTAKTLPYVNAMKKGEDAEISIREAVAGLWLQRGGYDLGGAACRV